MLSAPVDLGCVERKLAVASPVGFKSAPRSRTLWTSLVLTRTIARLQSHIWFLNDGDANTSLFQGQVGFSKRKNIF